MKVAILSATVYGTAEDVARHATDRLRGAGFDAWHGPRAQLVDILRFAPDAVLTVTSTTGMGELPDGFLPLYNALRDRLPDWRGRPGAIIALGDSSYGDTFCGGGELIRELYEELGLVEVVEMLRLDASETVTPHTDADPWIDAFAEALRARG